jgi:hypothetical protein
MAGEVEAAQQGIATFKEVMPLIKDFFSMFKEMSGSPAPAAAPNAATSANVASGTTPVNISVPGVGAVSTSLDGVAAALNRIAAALEKK